MTNPVDPTPATEPVVVPVKNPLLSKTNALGLVLTILGITTYFAIPEHTPTLTLASISEAVGGIATVVLRTWFTNQPVTQFAQDSLKKVMKTS